MLRRMLAWQWRVIHVSDITLSPSHPPSSKARTELKLSRYLGRQVVAANVSVQQTVVVTLAVGSPHPSSPALLLLLLLVRSVEGPQWCRGCLTPAPQALLRGCRTIGSGHRGVVVVTASHAGQAAGVGVKSIPPPPKKKTPRKRKKIVRWPDGTWLATFVRAAWSGHNEMRHSVQQQLLGKFKVKCPHIAYITYVRHTCRGVQQHQLTVQQSSDCVATV